MSGIYDDRLAFTPKEMERLDKVRLELAETLKASHMLKLEVAFFQNLERNDGEYGGIGVDCKRPFGNSDVEGDILEIIGSEPEGNDGEQACWSSKQRGYAASLYDNLIPWLQKKYVPKERV